MRISPFLVEISIPIQDSTTPVYFEVVLHGKTEEIFLEDPGASHRERIDRVSNFKAGRCVVEQEV